MSEIMKIFYYSCSMCFLSKTYMQEIKSSRFYAICTPQAVRLVSTVSTVPKGARIALTVARATHSQARACAPLTSQVLIVTRQYCRLCMDQLPNILKVFALLDVITLTRFVLW